MSDLSRPAPPSTRRTSPRNTSIRLLHVDDDPQFGELTAACLERELDTLDVVSVHRASEALDRFEGGEFDCVVSDFDMPRMDGLELLDVVRERDADVPFILFTGKGSEEIASEAISRGVTDYLQKGRGTDQYTVLANRVVNAVRAHRSRRALRRREASLTRAQRIANLGNWDWDVVEDTLFWSDQIYRIFGVDPEAFDATYEAFLGFVHPDDRAAVEAAVDDALAGTAAYSIDHRIVRPDGTERVVHEEAEVVRDDDGDPLAMNGTVQDITDRVERERDLEVYREAVEHAGHSIYWTDTEGVIQYVNPAFEAITGYSREEAVGSNPRILNSGYHDDEFYAEMWETIRAGQVWQNELVNERKNGERYVVRQTIAPVTTDDGEVTRYVAVNVEVDDARVVE